MNKMQFQNDKMMSMSMMTHKMRAVFLFKN